MKRCINNTSIGPAAYLRRPFGLGQSKTRQVIAISLSSGPLPNKRQQVVLMA